MMNTYIPNRSFQLLLSSLMIIFFSGEIFGQKAAQSNSDLILHYGEENKRIPFTLSQNEEIINLCGLEPGIDYSIMVSAFGYVDCYFQIDIYNENGEVDIPAPGDISFSEELVFTASETCMQFHISNSNCFDQSNLPLDLSVTPTICKDKDDIENSMAVLTTDYGYTVEELIADVFIGGGCFEVSNVQAIGNTNGIGHFDNGTTNIMMDEGVILASGNIANAEGPNNSPSDGNSFGDASGDPDLNLLGAGSVRDAVGIEFDFTPTLPVINFDYVFGSEEYCEFVNSTFNDVFGFFISGPGFNGPFTNGAENIALVPGTANYVAINSVNHLVNTGYFVPNSTASCNTATNPTEIEYDGYTTVLTATANVIPCETYHIRMVVSDIGDHIYDSGVFLRANSFDAGGQASVYTLIPGLGSDGIAYEGCSTGELIFERDPDSDLSMDYVVEFEVDPSSTATDGIDYSSIPNPVIIPAGQSSISIPFDIFDDGIAEGTETIIINLNNPCSCEGNSVEILINDLEPLEVTLEDIVECGNAEAELVPVVTGGVPDLTYVWSDGSTSPTLSVFTETTATYSVTVSDMCGSVAVASALIEVFPASTAEIFGDAAVCAENSMAELTIAFTGVGPWEIYYTHDGTVIGPISNITENPYTLVVDGAGVYELLSLTDGSGICPGDVAGTVIIDELQIELLSDVFDATCFGSNDGLIFVAADGGTPNYTYVWNTGDQTDFLTDLEPGTYTVTTTDANGCTTESSYEVGSAPEIVSQISPIGAVDCANPEGGSIDLTVNGGLPDYSFEWSNGATTEDIDNLGEGIYTVTVYDANGCTTINFAEIIGNTIPPVAVANVDGLIDCYGGEATISASGSSNDGANEYLWYLNGVLVSTDETFTVTEGGTYELILTNGLNGCTADAAVTVEVDQNEPFPDAVALGFITCTNTQATLDGSGSSGNGTLDYSWYDSSGTLIGTGVTIDVNAGGTYVLVVTDESNGCTAEIAVPVDTNVEPPVPIIFDPELLTCEIVEVFLDGSASSGDGSEVLEWYQGATFLGNDPVIFVQTPGTYTLIITNGINGCTAETSIDVSQDITPPPASINAPPQLTCDETSVILTTDVGGNVTYVWLDGTGAPIGSGPEVEVTGTGTYTLVVTGSGNGCTAEASVQVTENMAEPTAVTGADGVLNCGASSANLSGAGSSTGPNITYAWYNESGVLVGTELDIEVSEVGNYTLVVTDNSNGCTSEATSAVTPDTDLPDIGVEIPIDLTCTNDLSTLTGSSSTPGNIEYGWYQGGTLITNNTTTDVNAPGVYTFVVTNLDNGCTSEATVEVTENIEEPIPVPEVNGLLNCIETQIFLIGDASEPAGSISYEWQDATGTVISTDPNTPVDAAGTYTLIVTNIENGCTSELTTEVEEDLEAPTPVAVPDGILTCDETAVVIDGSGSSGNGIITYEWISGGTPISTESEIEVNAAGTYTLIITDETNGCTSTLDVNVDENIEEPTPQIDPAGLLDCINETVTLDASGSSGNGDITIEWLDGSGTPVGSGTTLDVENPGTYTIIVTNDSNGCTSEATVTVDQNTEVPQPTAATDGILTCVNESVNLTGSANGAGTIEYEWQDAGGSPISTANPFNVSTPGTYILVVTNTENGCTEETTVVVDENMDTPDANAGPENTLTCDITEVTLDGNGSSTGSNITYEWQNPGGVIVSTDITANVSETGTYTLVVTNEESGCTSLATVDVTPDVNLPEADAGLPQILNCAIDQVTLSGNGSSTGGDFEYEWFDPNDESIGSEIDIDVNTPGVYVLVVTNTTNGCTSVASVDVGLDLEEPLADAGQNQLLDCASEDVTLDGSNSGASTGGITYEWTSPGGVVIGSTATIDVAEAGVYQLLITAENGCTSIAEVEVELDDQVPLPVIVDDGILTCVNDVVNLSGSVGGAGTFEFEWQDASGTVLGTDEITSVSTPGVYTLIVLNQDNGCSGTTTIEVTENMDTPDALAGPDATLTCAISTVTLDGAGSSTGSNITYEWQNSGGVIVSSDITADVTEVGVYTIIVTNEESGCTSSATVEVEPDVNLPIAEAGLPQLLNCDITEVTLSSNGSSSGMNIELEWFDPNDVSLGSNADIDVTTPGVYTLIINNSSNGCTATASVQVDQDIADPIADAGQTQMLNCAISTVTLNGAASDGVGFEWTDPSGTAIGSAATIDVTEPGMYQLLVTGANGCTSMAAVEVTIDETVPVADPGAGGLLTCVQDVVTIGGSNTTTGPDITHEWVDENNQVVGTTATLDVTLPGTYTLNVYNSFNSCDASNEVVVTEDQDYPEVDPGIGGIITCNTTEITLGGTGTSTGADIEYSWLDETGTVIGNELELQVTQAGDYTLVVSNTTNDCVSSAVVTIDDDLLPPSADAGQNQLLTCDITTVNLDGSGSIPNTGDLTYEWTNAGGVVVGNDPMVSVEEAGTYQLLVTGDNGCTAVASVDVNVDSNVPVADAGPGGQLDCNIDMIVLGGTTTSTGPTIIYEWTNAANQVVGTDPTLDVNTPGVYTLTVYNTANDCDISSSVEVFEDMIDPVADPGIGGTLTCDLLEITLGGGATSTGSGIQYSWENEMGVEVGTDIELDINAPGTYTLYVNNTNNGCATQQSVTIPQDIADPIADAGSPGILTCEITSVMLDGSGSSTGAEFTYEWFNAAGVLISSELTPAVTDADSYTLIVTDNSNGCSSTSSVDITPDENLPTALAATPDILTCVVQEVTLNGDASSTVSGTIDYEWQDALMNSISNESTVDVAQPGIYTLIITDPNNGCTTTTTVEVPQNIDDPLADAGETEIITCDITEVTLSGTGTGSALTYEWFNESGVSIGTSADIDVSITGVYTLVVTDGTNGCTATSQVEVEPDNNIPVADAGLDGLLTCVVDQVLLDATGSSSGSDITYEWISPSGVSLGNNPIITATESGTYTLIVYDGNNDCSSQDEVFVDENMNAPFPDITAIGATSITCITSEVVLDGGGSAPFNDLTFDWSTDNGNITTDPTSPQIEADEPGTYTLIVTNTVNGCTEEISFDVGVDLADPLATVATPPTLTCLLTEMDLNANGSSTGNFEYNWTSTPAGGISSGQGTLSPTIDQPGVYTLLVTNPENGCTETATVTVDQDVELPAAAADVDDILDCVTESVDLSGNGSETGSNIVYQWTGSGILNGAATLNPEVNAAGSYQLLVTNLDNGCTQTAIVEVEENPDKPVDMDLDPITPLCHGDLGALGVVAVTGGAGPYTYSLDGEYYFQDSLFAVPAGTHTVYVQDAIGCIYEEDIYVADVQPVGVELDADITISLGEDLQLLATTNIPQWLIDTIYWTPADYLSCTDCLDPIATPTFTTDYTVTVVNDKGCEDTAEIRVEVLKDRGIYIPNAFSPNGDGYNDFFMVFSDGRSVKQINELHIYNRWGEEIFENSNFHPDDEEHGWDGTFREEAMNPGVFVYWCEIEFVDGFVKLYKGDVTIIK